MIRLRDVSLRPRLFALLMVPFGCLVVLTSWRERVVERREVETRIIREYEVLLDSVNRDFNELIAFGSPRLGSAMSRRLVPFEDLSRLFVYDKAGEIVYQYRRSDLPRIRPPQFESELTSLAGSRLQLSRSVIGGKQEVGGVLLVASSLGVQRALESREPAFWVRMSLLLALSGGLAFYLAARIAGPLLRLRTFLARVVSEGDYSAQLSLRGAPEWIATSEGVGQLLSDIAKREDRLTELAAEAQEANLQKGRFLANMSHELRTPIVAVLGLTEELQQGTLSSEETITATETIITSSEQLLDLLGDILDSSRLEEGLIVPEAVSFNPRKLVEDSVSSLSASIHKKGLEIHVNTAEGTPECVLGDPFRWRQIVRILVGNALKFTAKGHIAIDLSCVTGNANPVLEVIVSDTGIGIPSGCHERIFEAFAQADESETRTFGGAGLGLTLARQLAELLGGSLHAEDRSGGGSCFVLHVAVEELVCTLPLESMVNRSESPLTGWKILIAEDVPTNLLIATRKLERVGAHIESAENGKLAVDAAVNAWRNRSAFDVILMDMQMPVMGGLEAVSELRGHGYTGRIVALTAHATSGQREICIEGGCDDYATKPIKMDALLAAIMSGSH